MTCCEYESLSARRAWIEIPGGAQHNTDSRVALRKESVDRNTLAENPMISVDVALRKESVDRNQQFIDTSKDVIKVALRKESVDRNRDRT